MICAQWRPVPVNWGSLAPWHPGRTPKGARATSRGSSGRKAKPGAVTKLLQPYIVGTTPLPKSRNPEIQLGPDSELPPDRSPSSIRRCGRDDAAGIEARQGSNPPSQIASDPCQLASGSFLVGWLTYLYIHYDAPGSHQVDTSREERAVPSINPGSSRLVGLVLPRAGAVPSSCLPTARPQTSSLAGFFWKHSRGLGYSGLSSRSIRPFIISP